MDSGELRSDSSAVRTFLEPPFSFAGPNRRRDDARRTKRIYEDPDPEDGTCVLVDRLWPRGVSKEEARPLKYARTGTLTLLYAAADEEHNNAAVLADYLADRLDEG